MAPWVREDRPAVRAGADALAVMAALFEEQAQPDYLGGRTLDMQQIVDLLTQQSGVIVLILQRSRIRLEEYNLQDQAGHVVRS